jgi:hypothetical protein
MKKDADKYLLVQDALGHSSTPVDADALFLPIASRVVSAIKRSLFGSDEDLYDASTPPNRVKTIGLVDTGSRLSRMRELVGVMNRGQHALRFFEVHAAVPGGMRKASEYLKRCFNNAGRAVSAAEQGEFDRNVLADEFYAIGEKIRGWFKLDYLAGITPAMIAGNSDEGVFWNYIAVNQGPIMLISTADLRIHARQAGRPVEAAVGYLVLAQFLKATTPGLEFHDNRGCLFDFNGERHTIEGNIRDLKIEPGCIAKIAPEMRASVNSIVSALATLQ